MRILVAIPLILVTLAGPAAFCCCTSRVLAAALHSPRQTAEAAAPVAEEGCCHCQKPAPTPPTTPAADPTAPRSPAPCPCRDHGQKPALPQFDTASRTLELSLVPVGFVVVAWPAADLGPSVLTVPGPGNDPGGRPFLSAQDLLRAHHLLRC